MEGETSQGDALGAPETAVAPSSVLPVDNISPDGGNVQIEARPAPALVHAFLPAPGRVPPALRTFSMGEKLFVPKKSTMLTSALSAPTSTDVAYRSGGRRGAHG